jgi:hypothetical protein
MTRYRGSCHCGAVRFRLESEPITTGCRCNCSICRRKGTVMSDVYFAPDVFTLESRDTLAVYRWGDQDVNHYFCTTCGIYTFHDTTATPGHYRVNLGCIDDLDTLTLEIRLIDGRSF